MSNSLNTNNSNIAKLVIERRADMATQCECLAAWDDDRKCICDTTLEIPLSVENFKKAEALIKRIELLDRRIEHTKRLEGEVVPCSALDTKEEKRIRHEYGGRQFSYAGNAGPWNVPFSIPKKLILAAIRSERAEAMYELQQTGIISTDAANIRAVLK